MRSFLGVRVAIGSVKHLLQCSPLARGNRDPSHIRHRVLGPIPARAGQPRSNSPQTASRTAYPRSRGATGFTGREALQWKGLSPLARGNHSIKATPKAPKGLSPLARGNPHPSRDGLGRVGPIPARAGQP